MGDKSAYHSLTVGYNKFYIDKRYSNLKPCGDGSYGFVASATDNITGDYKLEVALLITMLNKNTHLNDDCYTL